MKPMYLDKPYYTGGSLNFNSDFAEKELYSFLQDNFKDKIIETKYKVQIRPATSSISFQESMSVAKPFKTVKGLIGVLGKDPQDFVYSLGYPVKDWRTKKLCFEFRFGKITATDNQTIWASNFENRFYIDADGFDVYNDIKNELDNMNCKYEIDKGELL